MGSSWRNAQVVQASNPGEPFGQNCVSMPGAQRNMVASSNGVDAQKSGTEHCGGKGGDHNRVPVWTDKCRADLI